MGWIKEEITTDEELLAQLKQTFTNAASIQNGKRASQSSSVCEYLTDYIRDYYDVTLAQCSRVSRKLADYYGIEKYYYEY